MDNDTVTAYHCPTGRNGTPVPVVFSVTDLTALWYDPAVRLVDIATKYHCSVNAVRKAATLAGLLDKSRVQVYTPKSNKIDIEQLKILVVDQGLNVEKAAIALGVSNYIIKINIKKHHLADDAPTFQKAKRRKNCTKRCRDFSECKRREKLRLPPVCEVEPDEAELSIELIDTDTAPSYNSGGGLPYCALSH